MIRTARISDRAEIQKLCQSIDFEPDEVEIVMAAFDQTFTANRSHQPTLWLVDADDSSIHGVAYAAQERMTDGTYNLFLIAVHPDQQKQGRGTNLIQQVERTVLEMGGRILLIETMAIADFSYVHRLYKQLGYEQEGQIRDFYAAGYDKVIFWKKLM
ncbi:MAG: GNAT family N-acetyltransferase [Cyanobacteria bacterium J06642_11]